MKRQCAGLVWHRMPKVERAKDKRTGKRTFEPYGDGRGGPAPYYTRQCQKMQEAEMCKAHSGFYVVFR